MDITPDTKDWTWVLERPCPECGFDTRQVAPESIGSLVRDNAGAWQEQLGKPGVRDRPSPDVWSPLEYACHVRDVFRIFDDRLAMLLTDDDPLFPNWDQDQTAVASRYGEQEPARVASELRQAGEQIATSFDAVSADQWQRYGRRSDGAVFSVDTLGRYFVHDVIHHLYDVSKPG